MALHYTIHYKAENIYDHNVNMGIWQFLIIPENNNSQQVKTMNFQSFVNVKTEYSQNGYGFKTIRVRPLETFDKIHFEAHFELIKEIVNPFDFIPSNDMEKDYNMIESLEFIVEHEPFLKNTPLTTLPQGYSDYYKFDKILSVFENLLALKRWVYRYLEFQPSITHVDTKLQELLTLKKGVCQDFSHLFCAVARKNSIPCRYVSGYLHQGQGHSGDAQMHAWVECFLPGHGWIGIDPTNNILVHQDHIKIAHGKGYKDCQPIKGILMTEGYNKNSYSVQVSAHQQ